MSEIDITRQKMLELLTPDPETGEISGRLSVLRAANDYDDLRGTRLGPEVITHLMTLAGLQFFAKNDSQPQSLSWLEAADDIEGHTELYRALGRAINMSVVLFEHIGEYGDQKLFVRLAIDTRSDNPHNNSDNPLTFLTEEEILAEHPDFRIMIQQDLTEEAPSVAMRNFVDNQGIWNFYRAKEAVIPDS